MTDAFPPTQPPRRPAWLAWIIIWLAVGYLVLSNMVPDLRRHKSSADDANDVQLSAAAKYAIGTHQLSPASSTQLLQSIDPYAKTPDEKVRAAIAAGELQDAKTALSRLDAIDAKDPELKPDIENLRTIYTSGVNHLDSAQKQRLLDRYQFFGRVALSFGQPDSDPLRKSVKHDSVRTVIILISALGIGVFAAFAGFILLILAIVFLSTGTIRAAYIAPPPITNVYVEMFAVYLVSFFLITLAMGAIGHGDVPLSWYWIASIVLPIAIFWGLFRGISWNDMRQALGWHGGRGILVELPLGIVGYIAGLPIVIAGFGITFMLLKLAHITPSHPIQSVPTGSPWQALQLYGIACVWAPVIEETMFRGALFNHMRGRWNWLISASVVAFIFASIHPQGWTFIPVLGAIAIVLAGIREWRGSILPSMIAHATNNFVMVSLLLAVK
jgi:membrane protease YdiL (CAAX protease family)